MRCEQCNKTGCIEQINLFYPKKMLIFEVNEDLDQMLAHTTNIFFPNKLTISKYNKKYQLIGINHHVNGNHWNGKMYIPWIDQCYSFDSAGTKLDVLHSGSNNLAGYYPNTNIFYYIEIPNE